jgi:hypothetical protein
MDSMVECHTATASIAILLLAFSAGSAAAGIGPCVPAIDFGLMCGSGDGAARAIVKTISPSKRLAFAWRLADKPPNSRPDDNDPNLENFVVRLEDGAILAKSHGAYWDLGTKIAKAYLMTAWSPDSGLLVKVEQRADSASAEVFSFAGNDVVVGPFDLVNVIKLAVLAEMGDLRDTQNTTLIFAAHPAMSVDDHGFIHAAVFIRKQDETDGRPYDAAVQLTRSVGSITAKVISITPYDDATISIIVH